MPTGTRRVGTIDGQVIIQVAATAPRGTARLSAEHASGLALKLIEAAARVMRADLAALLMFEAGGGTSCAPRSPPTGKSLTKSALFLPGLEHLDLDLVLARELLDQGLNGPAAFEGIRVWPVHGGRWTVCIGLVTPAGDTWFEAPAITVQEAGGARPGQGKARGAGRRGAHGASDRGGSAQGRSPNGHPPSPPPPPRPQ